MKSFQVIAVLSILAVGYGSQCYAPSAWDIKTCSICADLQGNQCVVNDQWYKCASSLQECCSTGAMRDAWDDDKYVAFCKAASIVEPSQPTVAPPPAVFGDCINAVSLRYPSVTNRDCMTACNNLNGHILTSSLFLTGACQIQSYKIKKGNVDVSKSPCFSNWIYGYSQEANAAAMNGVYLQTSSPAQCQLLCQDQQQDCVSWIWFSELARDKGSEYVGACALKNRTQVEEAVAQKTGLGSVIKNDYRWCSQGMPHQCNAGGFNCLKCDGTKRCVWQSTIHVAGYKDCKHHDACDVAFPTIRPTTTSTTKTHKSHDSTTPMYLA